MRTYSHTLLTFATIRYLRPDDGPLAAWTALGATLPDLPAGIGAAWLRARRLYSRENFLKKVCGRAAFRRPDAALHSILPVTAAISLYTLSGSPRHTKPKALLPFLLGWAGHIVTDALTHGSDARPLFWPVSEWRFESPISYRERDRHALPVTIAEHALVLAAVLRLLTKYKN